MERGCVFYEATRLNKCPDAFTEVAQYCGSYCHDEVPNNPMRLYPPEGLVENMSAENAQNCIGDYWIIQLGGDLVVPCERVRAFRSALVKADIILNSMRDEDPSVEDVRDHIIHDWAIAKNGNLIVDSSKVTPFLNAITVAYRVLGAS